MITSPHAPRRRLLAAVVLGAVAVMAAPASAHPEDEPGPSNYRSTVTRLDPVIDAIEVSVGGGDAYLELVAQPGHTVIIHGYGKGGTDPEPYLRINPDGSVDVNGRSPATYLNEDRYAESPVPTEARPDAEPHWVLRAPQGTNMVDWHDHRIHWMSPQPPSDVRSAPGQRRTLFDWTVPLTVDDKPVLIHGQLEWLPSVPWWLLTAAALGAAGTAFAVGRRSRRAPALIILAAGTFAGPAIILGDLAAGDPPTQLPSIGLIVAALIVGAAALRVAGWPSRISLTLAGAGALIVWALIHLPHTRLPTQSGILSPTATSVLIAAVAGAAVGTTAAAIAASKTRPPTSAVTPA